VSGAGAPELDIDGQGLTIIIVAAQWHERIMEGLIGGATRTLHASGAQTRLVRVPGSFELPVVCKAALESGADAVVALGVVLRGETPHFDYVADAATSGLTQVALETGKPVGFGVLTIDSEGQGLARAGLEDSTEDKGAEAAEAALASARVLRELRGVS
jgi:6,7-dimethyl-8-ribityllumazine synthase